MKSRNYFVKTKSLEFRDQVISVLKDTYNIDCEYNYTVSSWYINFICTKKTYKKIAKDLNLHISSIYVQREFD